jgi:hypothetical protein
MVESIPRRVFLERLFGAAGGATAILAYDGSLSTTATHAQPHMARYGNVRDLLPFFVTGFIQKVIPGEGILVYTGRHRRPSQLMIRVTSSTEICLRGCERSLMALQRGQRVDVGTRRDPSSKTAESRFATWIVANPIAGWGWILTAAPTSATIASGKATGPQRRVNAGSYTQVHLANGSREIGTFRSLRPGDAVHFYWNRRRPESISL